MGRERGELWKEEEEIRIVFPNRKMTMFILRETENIDLPCMNLAMP